MSPITPQMLPEEIISVFFDFVSQFFKSSSFGLQHFVPLQLSVFRLLHIGQLVTHPSPVLPRRLVVEVPDTLIPFLLRQGTVRDSWPSPPLCTDRLAAGPTVSVTPRGPGVLLHYSARIVWMESDRNV